ncbi:MAG: restriction endonuclease subunit S [Nanoarchaeota archaeon]|nr:restriction endonuclease subunit S [Nanoarchaeota archaeon]
MSISITQYEEFKESLRFDAEYYKKEYLETEEKLESHKHFTILSKVAISSKKRYNPIKEPQNEFYYVEIDGVNLQNGFFSYEKLKNFKAPSRARRLLEFEDVFVSTVRPNRNAVSIFLKKEKNFVCSTGFAVIKSEKINPYFLFSYLKTKYAINQLVRRTSAAMYPAVNETEILNLKIINPKKNIQEKVQNNILKAQELKKVAEDKYKEAEVILYKELKLNNLNIKKNNVSIIEYNDFISEDRYDAQFFSSRKIKDIFEDKFDMKSLKSLTEKIDTGLTPAKDDYWHKGNPVLKMGCLTNECIDWSKIEFANDSYYIKSRRFCIQEKDILLTSSAHALEHIAKKVNVVLNIPAEYKKDLVFVGELMLLRVKEKLINPFYLALFLKTHIGYKLLQNCIRGQTAHIYPKDVEDIHIPVINPKKQEKISKLIVESQKGMKEATELIKKSIQEINKIIEN